MNLSLQFRCFMRHGECALPIGLLNGEEIRKSLKTRDSKLAHERIRQWEADGKRDERPVPIAVKEACDRFVLDAEAGTNGAHERSGTNNPFRFR